MFKRKSFALLCALFALLTISLIVARAAAGGEIAGTVTDPKGAVVVGASVTVADTATGQIFRAVTDAQGRYKITGLAAGIYVVTIGAEGFGDARRENVQVEDGKAATLDVRLELSSIDAGSITVTATGAAKLGKGDAVYQQLRAHAAALEDFNGPYAAVNNLVLKRDAATFTLRSGEIYFLPAVEGRTTGAVFIGDGEFSLTPPVENERHSLALFTGQPSITEQFTKLTLRFTDKTFEEITASPAAAMRTNGAQSARARDIYRDNQSLMRKTLRTNLELRTLVDLYATERPGFFNVFIGGKRFEKLVFTLDPRGIPEVSPEEVLLMSYGESDRGAWTAFHLADEHRKGTASSAEDHRLFDITHHDIEAEIRGTRIVATDRLTLRPRASGLRVLPFDLYPTLRVSSVRDEAGRELSFVQENKNEDADFGVIWPEALEAGKTYKVTMEYRGDAIADVGQGNFTLLPPARSTWYPNNGGTQFGDRALFNVTFRYPKNHLFVGTGALAEPEGRDGDMIVAKWSSGQTELAVAGFNYGRFKKKEILDRDTGYNVEFYANTELPGFMRDRGVGSMSTMGGADDALADTQNATRIYNLFFGKLPYTRIAMSQQPSGNFGQAWPTLVYMPFTAYLDSTQRLSIMGVRGATADFFRYVGPHEVAHQWWGHLIGWTSYRDQWMSEGFAEFSTSLYVQYVRKDPDKFIDFWNNQRERITQASVQTNDRRPYMVGPVTQGFRLNSGKTGRTYQNMVYPKGAYILHMLRMMMFDAASGTGDKRFSAMMQDFIKTHYNKDVCTEDLKRIVEKHMTPQMNLGGNARMDWFFNQWVYGTEMPSYKLDYQLNGNTLSGRITQSGVSDNFRMLVPVYVDFGKGWQKIGAAPLAGNTTFDLPNIPLPQSPKRVALAAFNDVLALNIENKKK